MSSVDEAQGNRKLKHDEPRVLAIPQQLLSAMFNFFLNTGPLKSRLWVTEGH